MARYTQPSRLAWEDRWVKPSLGQLLGPIKDPNRTMIENLVAQLDDFDKVERNVTWYGDAWKWTIQYVQRKPESGKDQILCYLIPKSEGPLVCVPLTSQLIQKLPMRRLGKVVREGIMSAKCAVATYWATWAPNNRTEVDHLMDLMKRKHKLALIFASGKLQN